MTENPMTTQTIGQIQQALGEGKLTSEALTQAYLEKIEASTNLNAYVTVTADHALTQAKQSDQRIAEGNARPLEGVPIAVKDNFCTRDILTTAGSKMLHNFVPRYESTVTQRLWDAGAILLGKTNLDEFAMGSSTETSVHGPTLNPRGVALGLDKLTPGGSSGGSAAAVAANLAAAAIGSDTGGSIRQPASYCGIVGMKPTYGLCSRWGIAAYASSLDQAGAFGQTVNDVALVMDVMMGEDAKDTTSCEPGDINLARAVEAPLQKPRLGIPKELLEAASTPETQLVWQRAEALAKAVGGELFEVSMPNLRHALPAYYIIALSEASSNLARYDGVKYGFRADDYSNIEEMYSNTRGQGFGIEAQRRIMLGTFSLSSGYYDAYYKKAQQVRKIVANEFAKLFEKADLMLMPAAPTGAFELGSALSDPVQMYLEDVFTVPVNLAGLPGLSLPVAKDARGMPLGLQIIGPRFSDDKVVSLGHMFEQALG